MEESQLDTFFVWVFSPKFTGSRAGFERSCTASDVWQESVGLLNSQATTPLCQQAWLCGPGAGAVAQPHSPCCGSRLATGRALPSSWRQHHHQPGKQTWSLLRATDTQPLPYTGGSLMTLHQHVCDCVGPVLQGFVGEGARHYNPIILTYHF